MLSRNLKRALLDPRWPMPPTFLLPWAANLTTVSHTIEASNIPPPTIRKTRSSNQTKASPHPPNLPQAPPSPPSAPTDAAALPPPNSLTSPVALSSSVRDMLPLLKAQSPHYITVHIHGKPYLLTAGDTLGLPFLMHGVEPGDILRLNRAINIGSRDYTLKAPAPPPAIKSTTTDTRNILDPTTGSLSSSSHVMSSDGARNGVAPHFIPHIAQGKHSYLDERLFVCRAVVMGVESEPLRVMEKTKRRQRKVKKVKSKHRFTVLKVKEVMVKDIGEVDGGGEVD
ncbi:hypothetical protein LTR37_018857 [Vermiconidia calcicola]|uniref:Uncharacterized protein n=1 Tax=Vermiconidia calcicola TaxID=1690605 RepID=A0ACC3MHM6_9PEZI|nr:hypothetical protein LTR37_018857 [Vermiconidia calcicola]